MNRDIFALQLLHVPVFMTQVIAHMAKKEVRYYDTAADRGIKHAEEILDYIEDQWKKTKVGRFQRKDWTCVGSTKSQLPEQGLTNNCGVYTLMIAQLVHKELPLSALTLKAEVARKRIAFFSGYR